METKYQTFLVLFSTSSSVWAAIESICFKGRSRFVASIISRVFWLIQKAASSPRCKLSFKSGLESWNFHQGNQNYWKVFILCTLYISGFSISNLITSHFYNIKQILLDILHQDQVLWQVVRVNFFQILLYFLKFWYTQWKDKEREDGKNDGMACFQKWPINRQKNMTEYE